jgi:uroporphyrin-3 C-methyltransferase
MTDNSKSDENKPASSQPEADSKATETSEAESKSAKADSEAKTEIKVEAKAVKKKTAAKPKHPKTAGGGNYLAKLALLSSLIIAGGIFYLWRYHTDALEGQQLQLAQLQTVIKDQSEAQKQFDDAVKNELGVLHERQQAVTEAVAELLKTNRHLRHEWLVAEAEYLVNLASHRLILAQDANTAITALQAADDRLREAGDPSLIVLRKALAEDINSLQAVALPDIAGMSLKLNAIVQDVNDLPLLTPEPETATQRSNGPSRPPVDNWKELPAAMWEDMKKLVIIRDHQGPIKPLLSPEQHFFLTQNLKLQLEQARLALLTGENEVYQERLDTAEGWISNWFDPESNRTIHMLEQLEQLAAVDVQPSLPELTRTYQAFQAYHAKQDVEDAIEAAPTEKEAEPESQPEAAPENTNQTSPANPQVPL